MDICATKGSCKLYLQALSSLANKGGAVTQLLSWLLLFYYSHDPPDPHWPPGPWLISLSSGVIRKSGGVICRPGGIICQSGSIILIRAGTFSKKGVDLSPKMRYTYPGKSSVLISETANANLGNGPPKAQNPKAQNPKAQNPKAQNPKNIKGESL